MTVSFEQYLPKSSEYYMKCCNHAAVVIGFLDPPYTVDENDRASNIQIGVIQGSLERSVVVQFSTNAISAAGKSCRSPMQ